jgi:glutaminase
MQSLPQIDIPAALHQVYETCLPDRSGKLADYIPELSSVDPEKLAIAVVTADGQCHAVGDFDAQFAMESLSKPFVYGVALEDWGREAMVAKVGVSVSGMPFDSIIDPAIRRNPLQNPVGNAGTMATTSLIKGEDSDAKWKRVIDALARYVGRTLEVNQALFDSD